MPPEVASGRLIRSGTCRKQTSNTQPDQPAVSSLRSHIICIVAALLAGFIFTLTEHDDHRHTIWCVFEIAMQTLLVITATVYFRMRIALLHQSSVVMPILVMIACLSLICEPIQRLLFGTGHAFEILVMHSQCNLMLALAVCGFRMAYQRLAVLIAVFMTIFCCTISNASGLIPLTVLFAVTTIAWLVASWWETVDRRMLHTERTGMPRTWLALSAALPVLAMMAASGFGANTVTTALKGFMPSSGGTGEYSPFSRGGVNDGDALIAGNENIKSFGPIEDAPFLDSDKPSLYDVFDDTFDEPPRKIEKQERAISLPADMLKHIHQLMAEAKQAGREFSLLRSEKKADQRRIHDLKTHALFYLAGRTPLHLKMEVYELFDGVNWMATPGELLINPVFKQTDDRHWLNIPQPGKGFEIFSGTATHSVKVANLDGNIIPTPPHPVGVSIDDVNRADMYNAYDCGLIALNRESVPSMTPINFVSRCVDRSRLPDNSQISVVRRGQIRTLGDLCVSLPDNDYVEPIRKLAEECTAGIPRGWMQIEAVTRHLRENYVVDRAAKVSPDAESPLSEFLFETRRGPEYLFAGSAAVMLRSLGYSTRLVSGFYARPDKYDDHKMHTAVHAEDAHFWCEVSIGAGTWLTLEPSPGYEILTPPPGIREQLVEMLMVLWRFVTENAPVLMAITFAAMMTVICRKSLQNALLTLRWWLTSHSTPRTRAVHLALLVDHRLRLAGLERRSGTTMRRWSGQAILEPVRENLLRVADIADIAMYGRSAESGIDDKELDRLATRLSYQQLKLLRKQAEQISDKTQAA